MENLNEIKEKYEMNFNTEIKDNVLLISEKINIGDWYSYNITDVHNSIGKYNGMQEQDYLLLDCYHFIGDKLIAETKFDLTTRRMIKLTTDELFAYFKKIAIAKNFVEGFEFKTVEGNWQECNDYFDRIKYNDGCIDLFCNNYLIYRRGVWAAVRKIENKEMVFYSFIQNSEIFVALEKCKKESGFIHVFVFNKQTKEYLTFYAGTPFYHNYKELSLNDLLEYLKEVAKVKYANENLNFDCFWLDSSDKDFRLKYNDKTVYENFEWALSILGGKNKEFNEVEAAKKEIEILKNHLQIIKNCLFSKIMTKKEKIKNLKEYYELSL